MVKKSTMNMSVAGAIGLLVVGGAYGAPAKRAHAEAMAQMAAARAQQALIAQEMAKAAQSEKTALLHF